MPLRKTAQIAADYLMWIVIAILCLVAIYVREKDTSQLRESIEEIQESNDSIHRRLYDIENIVLYDAQKHLEADE